MQEVFEKIIEKLEEIRVKKTCKKEKCDTKELCRICVVDDAIEIVKQEAAEYNNGWLPVSDRLPTEPYSKDLAGDSITNAERIRSMSDEELADFIEMKQFFALANNGTDGEEYTLKWLQSAVEE